MMKVLFITNTPPTPTWGGAMAFYRHFCERKDFEIRVITDDRQLTKFEVPYSYLITSESKLLKKISNTRFFTLVQTYYRIVGCLYISNEVLSYSRNFSPDAIFTVGGSWNKMALLARRVSRKLGVPLIGSFNDWWYYNAYYYPFAAKIIERRFRNFYKSCDLAICTSEGMQEALGEHKNSVIIYPTGAEIKEVPSKRLPSSELTSFTVAFAGNLGDWYGLMLEALVRSAKDSVIKFKFFGSNPSWSKEFDDYVRMEKIYEGQISFEQLQHEMQEVDGLLLLMGFQQEYAVIEKTSFKTKFLDYISFKKPIMLWGPSYCSAVITASEFNSANICTSPNPQDFLRVITEVKDGLQIREQLVLNALQMYHKRFHPDKIHDTLRTRVEDLKKLRR
jgi:glycosyltransferase involved in cell wall biosynthesis